MQDNKIKQYYLQKKDYLFYLSNTFGQFFVQVLKKNGGEVFRTKRYTVLTLFSTPSPDLSSSKAEWLLRECNQRSLLPTEVVFDFDKKRELTPEEEAEYESQVRRVTELLVHKVGFYLPIRMWGLFSNSHSYHLHILFKGVLDKAGRLTSFDSQDKIFLSQIVHEFFKKFSDKFDVDLMLAGKNHMIAMEFVPHYKYGKVKKLILGDWVEACLEEYPLNEFFHTTLFEQ